MEKVSTKSPQKIRENAIEQEEVVTKDDTIEVQNNGEEVVENKEALDQDDDCDVDSLDSAIDPEEHRALPPALVRIFKGIPSAHCYF